MRVSIVTISYNQVSFLEQTIRSVLEQDYSDIEYIIVDAGSTDGSRDIIEKYRGRIARVLFEPDRGPADGLNKGFSFASGAILGYINSDDYYLPFSITKIVRYFKRHPLTDVVSGNATIITANNEFLRYAYSDKYSLLGCAYGRSNLIQPSSFFRTETFNKTQGFNVENHSNWDDELFIDMKQNGAIFNRINETLSAYRIYGDNISGSGNLDNEIKVYSDHRFSKIMGRKKKFTDKCFGFTFRFYRYITNPRDLIQRVGFGPVYGRYSISRKLKDDNH